MGLSICRVACCNLLRQQSRFGIHLGMKKVAYIAWQLVWGLPQTFAGLVTFVILALRGRPHFTHHGAMVTIWKTWAGLSLGPFIFINEREDGIDDGLLVHEYGHTIQSLILGPLYLLVIGLPSVIWLKTPALSRRRRERGVSYYTFYTERWANSLGEFALKRPSAGFTLID